MAAFAKRPGISKGAVDVVEIAAEPESDNPIEDGLVARVASITPHGDDEQRKGAQASMLERVGSLRKGLVRRSVKHH